MKGLERKQSPSGGRERQQTLPSTTAFHLGSGKETMQKQNDALGTGINGIVAILARVPMAVKRHHARGNPYK